MIHVFGTGIFCQAYPEHEPGSGLNSGIGLGLCLYLCLSPGSDSLGWNSGGGAWL
jgi:hypothetical protein